MPHPHVRRHGVLAVVASGALAGLLLTGCAAFNEEQSQGQQAPAREPTVGSRRAGHLRDRRDLQRQASCLAV